MQTWFGVQADAFISTLPKNIGIYAIIFFLLCIGVSVLFSLKKRFMHNVVALAMAVVSAQGAFLLVGSIYDILVKRQGVQGAIAELLGKMPELGASVGGALAVSKYVVSLVAVPALFLIFYGIMSLVGYIVFRYSCRERMKGNGDNVDSNLTAGIKIASGVISAVVAIVAYFSPNNTFIDLMTLPPIFLTAFATVRAIIFFFRKNYPESKTWSRVLGGVLGALTGAVMFVMLFFPFLAVADLACVGADAVPDEALACYEKVSAEEEKQQPSASAADTKADSTSDSAGDEEENPDVIGRVFHYTVETKKYLDSYGKTFIAKIYPALGVYSMHNMVAPVEDARTILRTTVVLGSYYYCEKNDTDFPDAKERLAESIVNVSDNGELNDVLQSLFCTATARTLAEDEESEALRERLVTSAKLSELETLDEEARRTESERLADVYIALCRVVAAQSKTPGKDGVTKDQLILFGELMDAMYASESFHDTAEPLLRELHKNPDFAPYIDPDDAMLNISYGEYSFATYMEIVTGRIANAAQ